jgi:hypothetical protein
MSRAVAAAPGLLLTFEIIIPLFCKIAAFICYNDKNVLITYSKIVMQGELEVQD